MSNDDRKKTRFNLSPTGHAIPYGRSADDSRMDFSVMDCGQFSPAEFYSDCGKYTALTSGEDSEEEKPEE